MRPAVFLDRDDTLIECRSVTAKTPHPGDLLDPSLVRLLSGVAQACAELVLGGFELVVVSNQGALAAGHATLAQIEAVNDQLRALIPEIRSCYFAPARPGGTVDRFLAHPEWRKPHGEMLRIAARELSLDLSRSWLIGDANRDVEAGIDAGLPARRCLRIGDGGDFADLRAAAAHILSAREA